MSVTATCGHVLTEKEGLGKTIAVKDYSKDGSRAISYPTLCDKCVQLYKKRKVILKTKIEKELWRNFNY